MATLHFITHPEIIIDPAIPIPDWPLSPLGLHRMRSALTKPWLAQVTTLFTSAERKATDTAHLIASHRALTPIILPALGENDRSATGYLPKPEFEATADLFFAHPTQSIRGWECALHAQTRIIAAIDQVIAQAHTPTPDEIAVISHGGVGALLLCHLKGVPISRAEDQPGRAGGCVFSFDTATRTLISGWTLIED